MCTVMEYCQRGDLATHMNNVKMDGKKMEERTIARSRVPPMPRAGDVITIIVAMNVTSLGSTMRRASYRRVTCLSVCCWLLPRRHTW